MKFYSVKIFSRTASLAIIVFYLMLTPVFAQTPPGDCPCDPDDINYDACAAMFPDECDYQAVPINNGVIWLLTGGVLLGIYVTYRSKKLASQNI